jgi:hypothetical protein
LPLGILNVNSVYNFLPIIDKKKAHEEKRNASIFHISNFHLKKFYFYSFHFIIPAPYDMKESSESVIVENEGWNFFRTISITNSMSSW